MGSSFGVDHVRSKHAAGPVIQADLNTPEGISLLWSWLANDKVIAVFLAPPCGTASRARQIPLKRTRQGILRQSHGPRPLRSDQFPNGLPQLSDTDNLRVSLANKLYFLTAQVVEWAVETGVIVCVENPQFSHFWATTFWQQVAHLMQYTVFHSCQYGSARQKKTMLAFNVPEFHAINATCKGQSSSHKHARWGYDRHKKRFATAEETAYPMGLAKMIGMVIVRSLMRFGISANAETLDAVQPISLQALQKMRATVGMQSKASRIPALIRTYKSKVRLRGDPTALPEARLFQRLRAPLQLTSNPVQTLDKGSKLLAIIPGAVLDPRGEDDPPPAVLSLGDNSEDSATQLWGIPWAPEEFFEEAVKAGHPKAMGSFLPKRLEVMIDQQSFMSAEQRNRMRLEKLAFFLKRAHQLRSQEADFKQTLHPDVRKILKSKRILLWQEMLQSINYEDMGVVTEFYTGTQLVGEAERTSLWPFKFTPASMTPHDLSQVSESQRPLITYEAFSFMDQDVISSVWEQTLAERDAGEIQGPFDITEIQPSYPLSKRFGVRQSNKIRCVDDFSQSSVNACAQTSESPKPHTVDVLCSMCLAVMTKLTRSEPWLVRSFDLKRAYRQCAVDPDQHCYSYIAVADPSSRSVKCFKMLALPFGSSYRSTCPERFCCTAGSVSPVYGCLV